VEEDATAAVEDAWAGGECTRVDERKKAKEARRMVNVRRAFWRARRILWEVFPNSDILRDGCEGSVWPLVGVMLTDVVVRR